MLLSSFLLGGANNVIYSKLQDTTSVLAEVQTGHSLKADEHSAILSCEL